MRYVSLCCSREQAGRAGGLGLRVVLFFVHPLPKCIVDISRVNFTKISSSNLFSIINLIETFDQMVLDLFHGWNKNKIVFLQEFQMAMCVSVAVASCQAAVRQPSVKVRLQPDTQQEMSHQDRPWQPCTKLPQQITDLHPSAVTPDWGGMQKVEFGGSANGRSVRFTTFA